MATRQTLWAAAALATFATAAIAGQSNQITQAETTPQNWLTTGFNYAETRFSPLNQITTANVKDLGLAWYQDLGTNRGQEATPIVVDGKIYVSTAWSIVKAFDAQTGAPLWTYDPGVPRDTLVKACCDAVSRGVAYWQGKIYLGALDGRLIAIDATTGKPTWTAMTVDQSRDYTITGAPRVIGGRVIIGNGGADMAGGVRGYVSAYDAQTGKMDWRFYTVPGDPFKPAENAALARAAKTWKGDIYWKRGGGGTAWDGMAYDPALDLLYIGTGNGGPWSQSKRSPGGGDNLYLSSIVAIRPETGEYVWHYQVNPGDDWDFTATQPITLADLTIDGNPRKVLMQAPKNGFFYVIDRETGKLISAEKIAPVNWASKIDLATGRPVENPAARYDVTGKPFRVWPSSRGAHSWQPMSYDKQTGLMYIPVQVTSQVFGADPAWVPLKMGFNTGLNDFADAPGNGPKSAAYLLAWDPVHNREAWRIDHPGMTGGGGVLTTAGGLLIQGQARGDLAIYAAADGKPLWTFPAQSMPMAGPVTYSVNGIQYIAVMAGCGGDFADVCGLVDRNGKKPILDRLLVFKLGGQAQLPPMPAPEPMTITATTAPQNPRLVAKGKGLFDLYCSECHGDGARSKGLNPDLRHSPVVPTSAFYDVVLGGALKDAGMASFAKALSKPDATAIRAYIISRAQAARRG